MYSPRRLALGSLALEVVHSGLLVTISIIVIMAAVYIEGKKLDDLFESDSFIKSLKYADTVVSFINKQYISLNDSDYSIYAEHLRTVLTKLVQLMKEKDILFNNLYQKESFAGSYADGLKIEKPTEYDMNLIIKLPVNHSKLQFEEATPSFIKIKGKEAFDENGSLDLLKWVDEEGYLLQTKFRDWMESVVTKALSNLPLDEKSTSGNTRSLNTGKRNGEDQVYKVGYKKSGPAITLKVTTPDGCSLDVDLVPAFQFGPPNWPGAIEPLPKNHNKKNWIVIPKPKKLKDGERSDPNDAREWRMSFLDQEREILNGSGTVKPTIKLLKKLRDAANQKRLSSYAIKTVVMLEMREQKSEFWRNRQTYLFLYMLNRLVVRIKEGHIPFYWDHRDDLLKLDKVQAQNVGNCLENILKSIIKRIDSDPCILAEKLLTKPEAENVREKCPVGSPVMLETTKVNGEQPIKRQGEHHSDDVLAKIFVKLEEIQQEQLNSSKVLEGLSKRSTHDGEICLNQSMHQECFKKQAELEGRISRLEDALLLLQEEFKRLKGE